MIFIFRISDRSSFITYTEAKASVSGKTVTFGPFEAVQPHEHAELSVHYQDSNAIMVAATHSAVFELTHWGSNVAVEENYNVHHRGAK